MNGWARRPLGAETFEEARVYASLALPGARRPPRR